MGRSCSELNETKCLQRSLSVDKRHAGPNAARLSEVRRFRAHRAVDPSRRLSRAATISQFWRSACCRTTCRRWRAFRRLSLCSRQGEDDTEAQLDFGL